MKSFIKAERFAKWCAAHDFRPDRFGLVVLVTWLVAAAAFFVFDYLFEDGLTHLSYDFLSCSRRGAGPSNIVLLYISDKTVAELGGYSDKILSRTNLGRLIDRIGEAKPNMVVIDLIFSETNFVAGEDEQLAAAMRKHGNVFLCAHQRIVSSGNARGLELSRPIPVLRSAARDTGYADLPVQGRAVRTIPQNLERAQYIGEIVAERHRPGDSISRAHPWLKYYGAHEDRPFASYPVEAAVEEQFPVSQLRDKIVMIGTESDVGFSGEIVADYFKTPYSRFGFRDTPGLEIHATAIGNLLNREGVRKVPGSVVVILWGLALALIVTFPRRLAASFAAFGAAALLLFFAIVLFLQQNIFVAWAIPILIQAPCALGARLILNPKLRRIAFISYRREDSPYAQLVLERLEAKGYTAFWDRELGVGSYWSQLEAQIERLPVFILIVTERTFAAAVGDEDVLRMEVALALKAGKQVIPFQAAAYPKCLPDDIQALPGLQDIQYDDRDVAASVSELAKAVIRAARAPQTAATNIKHEAVAQAR